MLLLTLTFSVTRKKSKSIFQLSLKNSESLQKPRDSREFTHMVKKEVEAYARMLKEGIPVNENTIKEMRTICNEYGIDMDGYLGKLEFE